MLGHPRQLRGGDPLIGQNAIDELRQWQLQLKCQELGMHVNTVIGRRLHELGFLGAKFDPYSKREVDAISHLVFVNICLVVKSHSS